MIQNYIFDLYGTLVDIHTDETKPSFWRRMALLYSLQGASYAPEALHTAYLLAVADEIDFCAVQRPTVVKAHIEPDILRVFESLYAQKGVTASPEKVMDTALFFRTLSIQHLRLYPDAGNVLHTLRERGRGVYLLSNAQAAFTVPELKKLGLFSCFDGMVLSSDAGIKKPDEAIFEYLLSKYGLRPETCVMIGNDVEADMFGAASAGLAGCYIHTNLSPDRRPLPAACREIDRLSDLL